jgi:outer membrane protein assembly factor BamD (BamD/ComL family)
MKKNIIIIIFASVLVCLTSCQNAKKAQEAFDKGLEYANRKDYNHAIEYFNKAEGLIWQ